MFGVINNFRASVNAVRAVLRADPFGSMTPVPEFLHSFSCSSGFLIAASSGAFLKEPLLNLNGIS